MNDCAVKPAEGRRGNVGAGFGFWLIDELADGMCAIKYRRAVSLNNVRLGKLNLGSYPYLYYT